MFDSMIFKLTPPVIYQSIISLLAALSGALIGGYATYKATEQSHKNNIKLEQIKEKEKSNAVILSIIEELKVLKESYETEMDNDFDDLTENQYLQVYYTITQDFFTIYTQNADKIGLISNDNLRNLIIKSYTYIKRYLEESRIYQKELEKLEYNRNNFIARVYPELINSACSESNTNAEINLLVDKVEHGDWSWLNSPYINQAQASNFFQSDKREIQYIIYLSQALKNRYIELKQYINQTIECSLL